MDFAFQTDIHQLAPDNEHDVCLEREIHRIEKGSAEPFSVCLSCGHIKGDALCCQPGQDKCDNCGLVKGSAGCCKVPDSQR